MGDKTLTDREAQLVALALDGFTPAINPDPHGDWGWSAEEAAELEEIRIKLGGDVIEA